MNVVWSLPVRGERLDSSRGDLVRARNLIEALREEGHRVVVVADEASRAARGRVTAYRRVLRPMLPGPLARAGRDLGRIVHGLAHGARVAAVARQERADLIVETQVHFAGAGAWASRRAGIPLLLDDCSPWTEEQELGAALPRLAKGVFLAQVRRAAALSAPTAQIRDRLLNEGAPASRVHVVPNGVDRAPFRAANRALTRRRMGVDDGQVVVAFVGSFQPWHRAEVLVDALADCADVPLHLLLIGEGPGRERVRARAAALGVAHRLTLPGPLHGSELAEALVASDIGVLPASNDYGQPMKLLDYAAAGLAIVAADVPPVREMLDPGSTGYLVPCENPRALSAALATLARFPVARSRLGRVALERLATSAGWRSRARTLLRSAGFAAQEEEDAEAARAGVVEAVPFHRRASPPSERTLERGRITISEPRSHGGDFDGTLS